MRSICRPVIACAALLPGLAVFPHAVPAQEQSGRKLPGEAAAALSQPRLQVQTLRGGLSVITGAGGNIVVWTGPNGTVLVDSGLRDASAEVFVTLARIAPAPLRFVIDTHGHADHTGGNAAVGERGATVVGHEMLRERAGRDAAVPAAAAETLAMPTMDRPTLTLDDRLALHMNGDRLDVVHVADAHTGGDVIVRWGAADVVALGDIYWSQQYPAIDLDSGGSLAGMVAAVEGTLARASARTLIVPGHGMPTGRAELAGYRDMLVTVGRKVREGIERGEELDSILAARPTAEFDARFSQPGALVAPDVFVRTVYEDLTRGR